MIRIDKIHIENFKGIDGEVVIDIQNHEQDYSILAGPNGYGKTTIFDALEICLTNALRRVNDVFHDTQQSNRNRRNNYLQNDPEKELILKLLIVDTDQSESAAVLIKRFDLKVGKRKSEAGREFIASDTTNLFQSYFELGSDHFLKTDFSTLTPLSQEDYSKKVNDFLFKGEYDVSNTYHLFNYIRQDDSISFLKIPEQRKGSELSFLFNTDKEESEKERIDILISNLEEKRRNLTEKINELKIGIEDVIEATRYTRLFNHGEFQLDIEEPFKSLTKEQLKSKLDSFVQELNELIQFRTNFDVDEYDKFLVHSDLNKVKINDAFMYTFLLSRYLEGDEMETVLKEFEKQSKLLKFKDRSDKFKIEDEFFEWFFSESSEKRESYESAKFNINRLNEELGDSGKIISDLLDLRRDILKEFELLRVKEGLQDEDKCPLCNSKFDTYDNLISSIESRTKKLKEFNESRLEEIAKNKKTIENLNIEVEGLITKYFAEKAVITSELVEMLPL